MGTCSMLGLFYSPQVFAGETTNVATAIQQANKQKVQGTVIDTSGPIIGASVIEKGTSNGAVTDFDGKFSLNVKPGATLVVSYVGYKKQEIQIGNRSSIRIVLEENVKMLNEVVAIGYGVQKKKLVTGATLQVKGEDIAKLNTTSALDALQAKAPGVQITTSSNQPNGGFKVYIRGIGTTGNSSPLYVIDGVAGGNLDNVNPADIESIDVLKDAASSAIYGARAANGVILVTTKQGKQGKVELTYDGYVGWSNPYKRPSTLNAKQYMSIMDEYSFNTTGSVTDWTKNVPQTILDRVNNGWEGTDWWDLYENKNAVQQNHSVNLTGGSELSKFTLGLSYTSNDGIMGKPMESKYDRYTGRINSSHILLKGKDRDIITIGENASFYYNKSNSLAETNIYWNSIHDVLVTCPLVPAYADNGSFYDYDTNKAGWSTNIFNNPLVGLVNGKFNAMNQARNFGFGGTVFIKIEPIKNLKLHSQYNVGYSTSTSRNYSTPYSGSATSSSTNYSVNQNASSGSSFDLENTLSYILPDFNGHKIDAMIGQSYQGNSWGNSLSATNAVSESSVKSTLTDFDHAWLTNVGTNYSAASISGAPWDESYLASFFGRINWNYKETYMATATLRMDGSSNFIRKRRWGTFPSFSAGWVVSNEKFLKGTKSWLDFLKIRASWGQNGNCSINNFQYLSTFAYSGAYNDNSYKFNSSTASTVVATPVAGAYADILPNEKVKWETSEQLDLGFDARLIGDRLGINFDYYTKKTKDWLIVAPTLDVYGTGAPFINGGDVKNEGFEIALTWNDRIGKEFKYHTNFNLAYNKNKVTRIANTQGIINGPTNVLAQSTDYFYRAQVGKPIGYFYGMSTSGVWQTKEQIDNAIASGKAVKSGAVPGDLIWVDNNGDGKIDYNTDRHEIGNPNPDFTLGFSLGCEYKGFDFSVTTHGAFGQQIMKSYRSFVDSWFQNYTTEVYDRWHGAGTSNTQSRLCSGSDPNNQWISDRYMENGDYLKIQNVTIGYDFNHIWKASPFQQLRLYFQAQNLYTFTSYSGCDPEIGSSGGNDGWASGIDLGLYPSSRTYLVGVSLKF